MQFDGKDTASFYLVILNIERRDSYPLHEHGLQTTENLPVFRRVGAHVSSYDRALFYSNQVVFSTLCVHFRDSLQPSDVPAFGHFERSAYDEIKEIRTRKPIESPRTVFVTGMDF